MRRAVAWCWKGHATRSTCGLLAGLILIRFVAHTWLLAALIRTHSLGALRIIFLGIPAYLFGLVIAGLIALALWIWLIADLALVALR